jgi:hypothetical protein
MNDIVSITGGSGLPEPTLGAIIYGDVTPKWVTLPGQITTTKKVLTQTGIGTVSAPPTWESFPLPLDGVTYEMLICNSETLSWGWPGTGNTFVGVDVAGSRTSGIYDSIFGFEAGHSITSGTANSVFGYQAQHSKTTGNFCNAFGYQAQYSLTTATLNNAFGSSAQYSLTTGSPNDAFGYMAQYLLTTGNFNAAFGQTAQSSLTTGNYNSAFGSLAQNALTIGDSNSSFGESSQFSLTTGQYNSTLGAYAHFNLTTGSNNTAFGYMASNTMTTTDGGVALGYKAGYYETGADKLFIDNRQRINEADGRIKALVYGIFADAVANQSLTFNANVSITGSLTLATPLAPVGAKYIVQEVDATLTNEQSLGALGTGLLLNTTTSSVGVLSIATDIPTAVTIGGAYVYRVSGTDVAVADGGTGVSTLALNGILFGNAANAVGITAIGVQYNILTVGASPFVPAWSGYLLSGTSGGKTTLAVTNAKTLTLTATDDYNLTVAATASISGTNTGDNSANSLYDIGSDTQAYSSILAAIAAGTWTGANSITTLGTIATGGWHGTTIDADHGGTGNAVYVIGDILAASTTTALSRVAAVAVGSYLASAGTGTLPGWATLNQAAFAVGSGLATADGPSFNHLHITAGPTDIADGDITVASGHGVDFSAAHSANAHTNLVLTAYEEGTWTPSITFGTLAVGITYTTQLGYYTKIGNLVTLSGRIVLTSKGSSTGAASVVGFPFTVVNNDAGYSSGTPRLGAVTFSGQIAVNAVINSTKMDFTQLTEAGVISALTDANFANTSTVTIGMSYRAA